VPGVIVLDTHLWFWFIKEEHRHSCFVLLAGGGASAIGAEASSILAGGETLVIEQS
jgi:hypothetical protein